MDPKSTFNVPWEENTSGEEEKNNSMPDENDMLLCHFSDEELIGLTALQGEELFNKEGIPVFPYLDKIAQDPEIREGIIRLFSEYKENPEVEKEINELGHMARGLVPYPNKSGEEEKNPVLAGIEDLGVEGDDRVAYVPISFVELLLEMNDNKPVVNPDDGLLMFGIDSVKNFIEYALPVIGMNNFTGDVQSLDPYYINDQGMKTGIGQVTGGMGQEGSSNQKVGNNDNMQNMLQQLLAQQGGAKKDLFEQIKEASPKLIGEMGKTFSALDAQRRDRNISNKNQGLQQQFAQQASDQWREERDKFLATNNKPFRDNQTFQSIFNPPLSQGKMQQLQNPYQTPFESYNPTPMFNQGGMAHGGYRDRGQIQGYGKGQDDTVFTQIPANTYVIDAHTNAMLGDGSSDAGADVLRRFVQEIRSGMPPQKYQTIAAKTSQKAYPLNVRLSKDEFEIQPWDVAALGNGSLDKGAKILDKMRRNILADKAKSGGKVPGKAKNPWEYIRSK